MLFDGSLFRTLARILWTLQLRRAEKTDLLERDLSLHLMPEFHSYVRCWGVRRRMCRCWSAAGTCGKLAIRLCTSTFAAFFMD
jgi:hypothetical protein